MNKKTAVFSILIISMLMLPSLLGVAYAGNVKDKSASATYKALENPGDYQVNIFNDGDVKIASIDIVVDSGAVVSNVWGFTEGWIDSYNFGSFNTLYATAEAKAVLHKGDVGSFTFHIDSGVISTVVFHTYDKKGNSLIIDYAVLES
ncbi:MAG: hypothetical protein NWF06_04465 [Candidatus Bathyarchaeota archaeon]|nr:hypothetical protein [Candidatus Bathyarchaeum sp.]